MKPVVNKKAAERTAKQAALKMREEDPTALFLNPPEPEPVTKNKPKPAVPSESKPDEIKTENHKAVYINDSINTKKSISESESKPKRNIKSFDCDADVDNRLKALVRICRDNNLDIYGSEEKTTESIIIRHALSAEIDRLYDTYDGLEDAVNASQKFKIHKK